MSFLKLILQICYKAKYPSLEMQSNEDRDGARLFLFVTDLEQGTCTVCLNVGAFNWCSYFETVNIVSHRVCLNYTLVFL